MSFPGIDVSASNKAGETVFGFAEKYFNEEIATVLKEAGGFIAEMKEEIGEMEEIQIEEEPSLANGGLKN